MLPSFFAALLVLIGKLAIAWFVAAGISRIPAAPIDANIEYNNVPGASVFADESFDPSSVIRSPVKVANLYEISLIFTYRIEPSFQY